MIKNIVHFGLFEWDLAKDYANQKKHGIDFATGARAFLDPNRIIAKDEKHGEIEARLFCIGRVGGQILTVRYTKRNGRIRIIGVGCWRKEARLYEKTSGKR